MTNFTRLFKKRRLPKGYRVEERGGVFYPEAKCFVMSRVGGWRSWYGLDVDGDDTAPDCFPISERELENYKSPNYATFATLQDAIEFIEKTKTRHDYNKNDLPIYHY